VGPGRFKQNSLSVVEEPFHEKVNGWLKQRLAARDFNQGDIELFHLIYNGVDRHLFSAVKSVLRIAVRTTKVATGQADEHTREAGVRRFPLDRMVDFMDDQVSGHRLERSIPRNGYI
jgi:hypothetical protein